MTWGIGTALMEHTTYDHHTARVTNRICPPTCWPSTPSPELEVMFVDKPDPVSTALGARGFGECPMTGVPRRSVTPSITPRPPRPDLPITQDKLL